MLATERSFGSDKQQDAHSRQPDQNGGDARGREYLG
jgi:hypothetical protein